MSIKTKAFSAAVEEIRSTFFPDWDTDRKWTFERSSEVSGYCDRDRKTILIGEPTENYDLATLIIHEIAHATTNDRHDDEWQAEMRRVAVEAGLDLKRRLVTHIDWVDGGDDVTLGMLEEELELAHASLDDPTCDRLLAAVAGNYGLTVELLEKQFPKLRQSFAEMFPND